MNLSMLSEERRREILELLHSDGRFELLYDLSGTTEPIAVGQVYDLPSSAPKA